MPKHRGNIATIYGDGEMTVYTNKVYTRDDFTPEYWGYVHKACSVTCRSYSPFDGKRDGLYKMKLSSKDLHSDNLCQKYGSYNGRECMILIPYVPKKLLRTIEEDREINLIFSGFQDHVTPEDRFIYFDTARLHIHCTVHYLDSENLIIH